MGHVCAFRHALALDERRVVFLPEYVNGGRGKDTNVASPGDVREVWFAGSHFDIGGGTTRNIALDTFGPEYRWMMCEAIGQGLKVNPPASAHVALQHRISPPSGTTTTTVKISRAESQDALPELGGMETSDAISFPPQSTFSRPANSLAGVWPILEVLPIRHLTYKSRDGITHRKADSVVLPDDC
ncbi:hypothetical protein HGRIS_013742 [Hohenbuehelia grisea]|uniref:T6SS Phospholipase effector Tle1-like catalytic domain-containing protein n=1 Tax=Hohenbuehelia grisea TaxID=104357 RepID=A0ABR3IWR0_9AGAR